MRVNARLRCIVVVSFSMRSVCGGFDIILAEVVQVVLHHPEPTVTTSEHGPTNIIEVGSVNVVLFDSQVIEALDIVLWFIL